MVTIYNTGMLGADAFRMSVAENDHADNLTTTSESAVPKIQIKLTNTTTDTT